MPRTTINEHADGRAGEVWLCLPCHEELLLLRKSAAAGAEGDGLRPPLQGSHVSLDSLDSAGAVFVPGGLREDLVLDEPPLGIELTEGEVAQLLAASDEAEGVSAVAATHYGPPHPHQDKECNEDYALSAILRDREGRGWAFGAVADGVSTKTFWPGRTARIACVESFRTVRKFIAEGAGWAEDSADRLKDELAQNLRAALWRDRAEVLEKLPDLCPRGWAREAFEYFRGRDEFWYNSTLLVACLGPAEGFVFWVGDGGVELVRGREEGAGAPPARDAERLLYTTESLAISAAVSLNLSAAEIHSANVVYGTGGEDLDLYLSSDGVDRTLSLNGRTTGYGELTLDDAATAKATLAELASAPERENDNYSIVHLSRRAVARTQEALTPPVAATTATLTPPPAPASPPPALGLRHLALAFLIGLAVGAAGTLLLSRPSSVGQSAGGVQAPGAAGTRRAPEPPAGAPAVAPPVAAPSPIVLTKAAVEGLDNDRVGDETLAALGPWLQHMIERRDANFAVVAYADREKHPDVTNCRRNAARSLKRAQLVADELRRAARFWFGQELRVEARQRVCEKPPGVEDIKGEASRRLLLRDQPVENCDCTQER